MTNKEQDPNLQAPQDSNTTKHINFREVEESDASRNTDNDTEGQEEDNPTKKAWEEMRNDQEKGKSLSE